MEKELKKLLADKQELLQAISKMTNCLQACISKEGKDEIAHRIYKLATADYLTSELARMVTSTQINTK